MWGLIMNDIFTYDVSGDEVTITGFVPGCEIAHVVIPDEIAGLPVIGVAESAFKDGAIEDVVFGEGLRSIGDFAFANNSINKIVFGRGIQELGRWAFARNKIKNVIAPHCWNFINEKAFHAGMLFQ